MAIGSRIYQTSLGKRATRQVAGSTMQGWAEGSAGGEVVVIGSGVCHMGTGYWSVLCPE